MTDHEIARALRATGGDVVAAATKLILAGPRIPKKDTRYTVGQWLGRYFNTGKKVKIKHMVDAVDDKGRPTRVAQEGEINVDLVSSNSKKIELEPIFLREWYLSAAKTGEFDPDNYNIVYRVKLEPNTIPSTRYIKAIVEEIQALIQTDSEKIEKAFKKAGVTYIPWTAVPKPPELTPKSPEYRSIEAIPLRSGDPPPRILWRSRG